MYLIISLVVLMFSFYLFKSASGSMSFRKLNIISVLFYFNIFLTFYIGSVLVVYKLDDHYIINRILYDSSRLYGWMSVLYCMVMLPLGMIFVKRLLNAKSMSGMVNSYFHAPLVPFFDARDFSIRLPLYSLVLLAFFAVGYTFYRLGFVPILYAFQDVTPQFLAEIRHLAGHGDFGGRLGFYAFLYGSKMTPILAYIFYAYWRMTKKTLDLNLFLLLFALSLLIVTYSMSKAPILKFLLGFLILHGLTKGYLTVKTIVIGILSCFIIFFIMYSKIMLSESSQIDIFQYNKGFIGRIILGQTVGLFSTFDIFPHKCAFLGINSFLPGFLNPEPTGSSSRVIMLHMYPEGVEAGIAGTMSNLFIGEAWANFGLLGVIIAPFYVGVILGTAYILFLRAKKTPIFLGLYTYFCFHLPIESINAFIYDRKVLMPLLVILSLVFVSVVLKEGSRSV